MSQLKLLIPVKSFTRICYQISWDIATVTPCITHTHHRTPTHLLFDATVSVNGGNFFLPISHNQKDSGSAVSLSPFDFEPRRTQQWRDLRVDACARLSGFHTRYRPPLRITVGMQSLFDVGTSHKDAFGHFSLQLHCLPGNRRPLHRRCHKREIA